MSREKYDRLVNFMGKIYLYKETGYRLKKIRELQGLTQQQVAVLMGVSLRSYQRYEQGERLPDVKTLSRIAKISSITSNAILYGTNTKQIPSQENESNIGKIGLYNSLSEFVDEIEGMINWIMDLQVVAAILGKPDEKLVNIKQELFDALDSLKEEVAEYFDIMSGKKKHYTQIWKEKYKTEESFQKNIKRLERKYGIKINVNDE